jgi:hypothetical protein
MLKMRRIAMQSYIPRMDSRADMWFQRTFLSMRIWLGYGDTRDVKDKGASDRARGIAAGSSSAKGAAFYTVPATEIVCQIGIGGV